jgi:hypothetical protein
MKPCNARAMSLVQVQLQYELSLILGNNFKKLNKKSLQN